MRLCSGAVLLLEDRRIAQQTAQEAPASRASSEVSGVRQMRQLTEDEIRQFYEAYRATEACARVYHRAAMRHLIQCDFLFFALVVAVFLGVVLYHAP